LNESAQKFAVTRGNLKFTIYQVSGSNATQVACRDVESEIKQNNAEFSYKKGDKITALRFKDANSLRINFRQDG